MVENMIDCYDKRKQQTRWRQKGGTTVKKTLLIGLGFLMFGLGTLGIFLLFLPTTIFYLLTAFFWLRSSAKLHQRFISSEKYQQFVAEPLLQKKITNKGMVKMFVMMGIVFLIPGLLINNFLMRFALALIYFAHVGGLTFYLRGKKVKRKETGEIES